MADFTTGDRGATTPTATGAHTKDVPMVRVRRVYPLYEEDIDTLSDAGSDAKAFSNAGWGLLSAGISLVVQPVFSGRSPFWDQPAIVHFFSWGIGPILLILAIVFFRLGSKRNSDRQAYKDRIFGQCSKPKTKRISRNKRDPEVTPTS